MASTSKLLLNFRVVRSVPSSSLTTVSHQRKCLPVISRVITERLADRTLHPWCDVVVPPVTYCDYVWDKLDDHGHLPALVCGVSGETWSHGQVKETAMQVARALASLGLRKGNVVAVVLPNCLQYPPLVLGCLYLGVILTPINPSYTAQEISRQLSSSKARLVFSHSLLSEKTGKVLELSPLVERAVVVGQTQTKTDTTMSWQDFLAVSSDGYPEPGNVQLKSDVAILPYSSGTTGMPKGVMLSQHNMVAHSYSLSANDPEFLYYASGTFQDVTIAVLPMFHIYGLGVTMTGCLHHGAKQVVMPGFEASQFVKLIEEHKPSFLHLVPPLVSFLASSPLVQPHHLTSLRAINSGAAPAGTSLISQFYEKAPSYTMFKEGWGQTEVSGGATGIARAYGGIKLGSCNQLIPNLRLQVRDTETDLPLGQGEVGEIVVKGDSVMLGYMDNEEANKKTFDKDGWMRSGDIGYFDQDGFLYVVDRIKELIKVAPAELEDVLRGLKGVLDVAVIGVESEKEGEIPRAYIVRDGESLSEEEVHEYMKEQVALHKQLKGGIQFVEKIPKSAAGKILRKDLKALYKEAF